ncbi:hypothetical protein C8R43DRAFT_1202835 [Mycena crocata]|nr:hypothetical protein C8R43DRAFT_1202835 [Mycena crocata]
MFDAHTKQQQHPPLALIPPPSPPTFSLPFPSAAILELPYPPGPYLNLSMAFLARFNNGARHFDNLKMVLAEALGSIQALACLRRAQCRECRRFGVPAKGGAETILFSVFPRAGLILEYFHTSPRVGRRVAPPSKFNYIFGVPGNSAHQCSYEYKFDFSRSRERELRVKFLRSGERGFKFVTATSNSIFGVPPSGVTRSRYVHILPRDINAFLIIPGTANHVLESFKPQFESGSIMNSRIHCNTTRKFNFASFAFENATWA